MLPPAYLEQLSGVPLWGRCLALPTNNRLGIKTLAYLPRASVKNNKPNKLECLSLASLTSLVSYF
jgi:hypothetical protein